MFGTITDQTRLPDCAKAVKKMDLTAGGHRLSLAPSCRMFFLAMPADPIPTPRLPVFAPVTLRPG
jgi:hypothetical protein